VLDSSAETKPAEADRKPGCGDRIGRLCCHVQTEFGPLGDGYSVLKFSRDGSGWTMTCDFDRSNGSATIVRELS
jgi:hypothetical protein